MKAKPVVFHYQDPVQFEADLVEKQNDKVIVLTGEVKIEIRGVTICGQHAVVDSAAKTITVEGDTTALQATE